MGSWKSWRTASIELCRQYSVTVTMDNSDILDSTLQDLESQVIDWSSSPDIYSGQPLMILLHCNV
jgi:hypothetical protein